MQLQDTLNTLLHVLKIGKSWLWPTDSRGCKVELQCLRLAEREQLSRFGALQKPYTSKQAGALVAMKIASVMIYAGFAIRRILRGSRRVLRNFPVAENCWCRCARVHFMAVFGRSIR